jgi:hypothetical protein
MSKRFVLTEHEVKEIRGLYGLITEATEPLVIDCPVTVILTPVLLTVGVAGEMLKNMEPFERVQVAGVGRGVITTVAQLPVTVQLGSPGGNSETLIVFAN